MLYLNYQSTAKRALWAGLFLLLLQAAQAEEKVAATDAAPKPDSPWAQRYWFPAHAKNLKASAALKGKAIDLLLLGDSITHGFGGAQGRQCLQTDYAGKKTHNLGVKGDTTSNVLWRLEKGEVEGLQPKITILMIGTNNTTGGYAPEETAAGIKAILAQIQERLPKTKILLLGVFPRGERGHKKFNSCNASINKLIESYGDNKKIFWQDLSDHFQSDKGIIKSDLYGKDQLHINAKGYTVWSKAMKPTIEAILSMK